MVIINTLKKMTFKRKPTSKYNAQSIIVDGTRFDSKGEARRYAVLKLLERAKEISNLRRQVPYNIEVQGMLICKYVADFVYVQDGREIVEDFKGVITPEFKLKRKLMKAVKGIDIVLTKAK